MVRVSQHGFVPHHVVILRLWQLAPESSGTILQLTLRLRLRF
jgi:hypothetical protein